MRGQIAATRRLVDIQTQLLAVLRRQNQAGQIALPDVVAQETAVAQARLFCRRSSERSDSSAISSLSSRGGFPAKMWREV